MNPQEPETIHDIVHTHYAAIARATLAGTTETMQGSCCATASGGGTGGLDATTLATCIGYTASDLSTLPEGANMGLSCGNPTALASLTPGEVVLDLGSGGGFDVFLAGPRVGPTGRAIGVDMTPDMLALARKNARTYREQTGLENVEFRLGEIEHLPVADASVDVVISNCVITLSPDKPQVWREIARVLKPGGRAAVSDLVLLRPLPVAVAEQVETLVGWVGCLAGAALIADVERMIGAAGLRNLVLERKPAYIHTLSSARPALFEALSAHLPTGSTLAEYITSLDISAYKPS
jgi:SAM-dependent methyltransferase